jgi:Caspase domain
LISFSTQPGNVALDGAGRNSPYAAALLKHLPTPGDDLPTILINVRNDVMQETGRRQVPWEHSAMTAKFYFIPPKTTEQQIELAFWASVKDSDNPSVLTSYLERYPDGSFASLARALIEQHKQQQEANRAAREAELRRQDEARKQAEVERLETERKAAEGHRAELQKALEEVRIAREAAGAAEEQRAAAVKAAAQARKVADAEAEKGADRPKIAALPKLANPFDGTWQMVRISQNCGTKRYTPTIMISNGVVLGSLGAGGVRGSASASGVLRITHQSTGSPGGTHSYSGTLRGNSGSGTFSHSAGGCDGTFTLTRR